MLQRLLRSLSSGSVHHSRELAQTLGVSEELLLTLLDGLERMGYLRASGKACCGECEHCPVAGGCAVGGAGRVWALTEAGKKAAQ